MKLYADSANLAEVLPLVREGLVVGGTIPRSSYATGTQCGIAPDFTKSSIAPEPTRF